MSGNPNRFPHDRRPHQAQSQGTKLYQTASTRPNNGAAPPTNVTSAAPSLNTFSFRPQSTGTALYTTGSASKAFESVGKGGLRFDLKQQPQKQQQQPQQHQRSSSNSTAAILQTWKEWLNGRNGLGQLLIQQRQRL
ncbi:hypothetical protein BCR33DRAFT_783242 [Rhizoclosmatium globosum]|uniref:Uncharacterized protein n=1 Tax=Rhizoclosmatium globosum TaxID=329046 RepID=A0A1Y2CI89_9FUNG|nr:hypothetical protein BCR33DRAFT_783242 [Rhizoclosmatium globosum]|eukprot:ORY46760.1 hypothetical protein BCR33DRAFT_783242 [Rhizoclosmatium globosum]